MKKELTVTNGTLQEMHAALTDAEKSVKESEETPPIKLMYAIAKNTEALSNELKVFEEQRVSIITKHAGGGDSVDRDKDPDAYNAVVKDLTELMSIEANPVSIRTVELKEFDGSLLARYIPSLLFMIDEAEDDDSGNDSASDAKSDED